MLCRNNSISDGVSIRGAFEVASFRLSKAVEGVTEPGLPPNFKLFAMFAPEKIDLNRGCSKDRGIWFACEHRRCNHVATAGFNISTQIRQCTALSNEVVDHQIIKTQADVTSEIGLPRQAGETIRTCMADDIGLNNRTINGKIEQAPQFLSQRLRYRIDAILLQRVR